LEETWPDHTASSSITANKLPLCYIILKRRRRTTRRTTTKRRKTI